MSAQCQRPGRERTVHTTQHCERLRSGSRIEESTALREGGLGAGDKDQNDEHTVSGLSLTSRFPDRAE